MAFVAIACDELQQMKGESNRDSASAPAGAGSRRVSVRRQRSLSRCFDEICCICVCVCLCMCR